MVAIVDNAFLEMHTYMCRHSGCDETTAKFSRAYVPVFEKQCGAIVSYYIILDMRKA